MVEDNELNQEVALGLLDEFGFLVDVAENGQVAIDRLRKADYDIVLMDMQMPVLDGVSATVEIRKDPRFQKLPIVAMTANAMTKDRERCAEAGMNGHIAKPIDPDELYAALLKFIEAKKPATVVESKTSEVEEPFPEAIAGVDIPLGMRRVLGKKPLYKKMLRKFVGNQEGAADLLKAALDQDDWESAERIAHSSRGVCGNIGATETEALAGNLERAIAERLDSEQIATALSRFSEAMSALIAAIVAALPAESPVQEAAEPVDSERAEEVLAELRALLAEDDSEASDLIETHQDLLKNRLGQERFQELDSALKDFDFERALQGISETQ